MGIVEQYLLQLNTERRRWRRAVAILTALSLLVALTTGWNLRMTAITIANSASCGVEEHQHSEECVQDGRLVCGKQSHVHNTGCYSDPEADAESWSDWKQMFDDYPYTGDLRTDLVGIAKTQVGYTESLMNYEADEDGVRHGYTRYGQWYGAPYNDWSAMFVSFCLHYAGADPGEHPSSSGASSMAELWKKQGKFTPAGEHIPQSGDIVFFNNNTVGIVAEVFNATFCVIRGDWEDGVRSGFMPFADPTIVGWGITGGQGKLPEQEVPQEKPDVNTNTNINVAPTNPQEEFPVMIVVAGAMALLAAAGVVVLVILNKKGILFAAEEEQDSVEENEPCEKEETDKEDTDMEA